MDLASVALGGLGQGWRVVPITVTFLTSQCSRGLMCDPKTVLGVSDYTSNHWGSSHTDMQRASL